MSRTSLTKFTPQMREPDPANAARAKREAWQQHGLIMIDPDKDITWDGAYEIRETFKATANRLYGKRKTTNGKR